MDLFFFHLEHREDTPEAMTTDNPDTTPQAAPANPLVESPEGQPDDILNNCPFLTL